MVKQYLLFFAVIHFMKQIITPFFKGMRPLEVSQYLILGLMAIVLPFSWVPMTWLLGLLVVNTCLLVVANHKLGNQSLQKWARWSLWLLVAFYMLQIVSLLYTSNMDDAGTMLMHRLPLLLFPLCCLACDTAYMTRGLQRMLVWLLTGSLFVKFFIRLVYVLCTSHKIVFSNLFDPVHHSYVAMYLLFVLGFVYSEWFQHRDELKRWMLWALAIIAVVTMTYIVLVISRAGIAGMVLLILIIIFHLVFIAKEVKLGMVALALTVAVGVGVFYLLPEDYRRLTRTFEEMSEGDTSDARYLIFGSSLKAIGESLPFGVGIGDRGDVLAQVYEETGEEYAIKAQYNSHNIYLDATLTMGIPGILLLLAVFVVPAVGAYKRDDFIMLSLLFSITFSGLFEAVLNRQMGVVFMGLFWFVLLSGNRLEHKQPSL